MHKFPDDVRVEVVPFSRQPEGDEGCSFFVTLPVAFRYSKNILETVGAGYSGQAYQFIDLVAMALFTLIPLGAGLAFWLRSLGREWSTGRDRQARVA
jgi:hypothetical protein